MQRIFTIFLGSLILSGLFPMYAFADFSDVPAAHPNAEAIAYVRGMGIAQGYADGTFRPDITINRAEFTKIVAARYTEDVDDCRLKKHGDMGSMFSDMQRTDWYAPYVCAANLHNLINGYPDRTFQASNLINFAEASKILTFAYNLYGDVTDVWYERSVRALETRGAIPLSISSFNHSITRGEMAEMIYRLNMNIRTRPSRTYEEMAGSTIEVKLFFGDKKEIVERSCAATRSVTRLIPKTSAVADATLRLLLRGVTEAETSQALVSLFDNSSGYFDSTGHDNIQPLLSYYQGISIVDGVATVKFTEGALVYLNNTSCVQEEVKGSIGDTLLQFPSIKSIQYSIDGKVFTGWDG